MRLAVTIVLFIIFSFLGVGPVHAQLYEQWNIKFGDQQQFSLDSENFLYPGAFAVDPEGNSYMHFKQNQANFIRKVNSEGHVVWQLDSVPDSDDDYQRNNNLRFLNGYLYYINELGITKYDAGGNIIWTWSDFGLSSYIFDGPKWVMDADGSIIISWQLTQGQNQVIAKIDSNGTGIWADTFAVSSNADTNVFACNIVSDLLNNVYLSVSAELSNPGPPYTYCNWLFKYSPIGNLDWTFSNTSLSTDGSSLSCETRSNGNVVTLLYTSGLTRVSLIDSSGTVDTIFNRPSYYSFPICVQNNYRYYFHDNTLVKTDSMLNVISSTIIPDSYFDFEGSVYDGGHIYLIGLGENIDSVTEIYEYDYNCNLIGTLLPTYNYFNRNLSSYVISLAGVDNKHNLYVFSYADSAELYKYCSECSPNLSGQLYYDSNQNCQLDSNEHGIAYRIVKVTPGPYFAVSNSDGNFGLIVPVGQYSLTQMLPPYWSASCADTLTVVLDSTNQVSNNNLLGSYPTSGIRDMQISLTGGQAVLGYHQYINVSYGNVGTMPDSGWVQLNFDSLFIFEQSWPKPDSISELSLFWRYNFQPGQSGTINLLDSIPGYISPFYVYEFSSLITPIAGDTIPGNNFDTLAGRILSSFDPNLKSSIITNPGARGSLTDSSVLTYTIAFQNTGTDTAYNIVVVDTLDTNLDISTFKVIQTSLKLNNLSFIDLGTVQLTFENAFLPDSGTNMAMSQAFIKYSISPHKNLSQGATIFNAASIYFDFNPGVSTNTTVNYFDLQPSGINESFGFEQSVQVYPNPMFTLAKIVLSKPTGHATLATIYDMSGRTIRTQNFGDDNNILIEKNSMAAGLYMVELKQENRRIGIGKIVVQ